MSSELVLRDIHQPPAPPWWPPAPGWWLVGLVVLAVAAGAWLWRRRRTRRRRRIEALFDDAVSAADAPAGEIAAMSALLRRAARRHRADADTLRGEAWRALLDEGRKAPRFAGEEGALLVEGGFQRDVDPECLGRLRPLARARFLEWMGVRR